MSPSFTLGFVLLMSALFVATAALINPLCLALSVPVLAVLFGYSHAKRFTSAAHFWLGFALALAPIGAWIAVTGSLQSWTPLLLALAVVVWVAGFDILYALADIEHDRHEKLFSIPALLGERRAMDLAALLHAMAFGFLVLLGKMADLGLWYFLGLLTAGALLLLEHRLVRPGDLTHLPSAFLTLNGLFSVAVLLGVLSDVFFTWIRG